MKFEVHHHYHHDYRVLDLLNVINSKLNKIMSKQEELDAAVTKLTASASDIANDLTFLKEQIANGTVSDESIAKLTSLAETFKALGDSTDSGSTPPVEGTTEG